MSAPKTSPAVRACAAQVMRVISEYDQDRDPASLRMGLVEATRPLVKHPELFQLGTKRVANHIDNSRYLYYDGLLSMTLDEFPKGKLIPPHDHGIWEALILCSGKLRHTVYGRADDGTVPGRAELKVTEDIEMAVGDIAMVVPPADIHSFQAVTEGTFVITIVGGEYAAKRHYYNTNDNTYAVRTPTALRESGALG